MSIQLQVGKSTVSGMGLFAQSFIPKGKILFACAHLNNGFYHELEPGNFMNHTDGSSNICMVVKYPNAYIQATRDIQAGEELLLNYAQAEKALEAAGIPIDIIHNTNFLIFKNNPQGFQELYNQSRDKIKGANKPVGYTYLVK